MVVSERGHWAIHFEVYNYYCTRPFEQGNSAVFALDWIDGDAADPELPILVCDLMPAETFCNVLEDPA